MHNLDKVYERLRKRAQTEWLRNHTGADPSDACVSVRITTGRAPRSPEPAKAGLLKPEDQRGE